MEGLILQLDLYAVLAQLPDVKVNLEDPEADPARRGGPFHGKRSLFQIWLILKTWEVLRVATARIHRNPPAFIGLHDQNLTSHRPAAVH